MICECGGIFNVIRVEKYPEGLPKHKIPTYDRVCDVECIECGKVLYSQAYDFGKAVNLVKDLKSDN